MKEKVLLDTGPLVAFLNRRDRFHDWAVAQWDQITPPMLTCEAVISEACFLLAGTSSGSDAVMKMIQRKIIMISFHLAEHIQPVKRFLLKYRSVPMSLADACLIRMSELYVDCHIFTLDSDFNLYRKNRRRSIPTITP
ncbi:MAG: PIN domain-containing protein [Deltaproteobacteria bacterium]|nr:PIN domain-containing protein [Deltaproteobacteria bacterium]